MLFGAIMERERDPSEAAAPEAAVPAAEGLEAGAQAASFAELARALLAGLTQNGVAIRSLTTGAREA